MRVPPGAGFLSFVSVDETTQSHNSSQSEHYGVETQPGKVNANLLPVILPVGKTTATLIVLFAEGIKVEVRDEEDLVPARTHRK